MTGDTDFRLGRPAALAITLVTVATAFLFGVANFAKFLLREPFAQARGQLLEWMTYTLSVLSVDYRLGLVRRGLGGTIAHLFGPDPFVRGIGFHAASLIALLIPVGILVYRLLRRADRATALFLTAFLMLSPQLFLSWRVDFARTDMLAASFVAWSLLLALADRWIAAAMLVAAGLLVHEVAVLYGVPLLAAVAAERWREGAMTPRRGFVAACGFVAVAVPLMLLPGWLGPTPAVVAAAMHAGSPPVADHALADLRDTAIYMQTTNGRGVLTAMCSNRIYPGYGLMLGLSLAILAASAAALGLMPGRRRLPALFACVAPLLALNIVASDAGRWLDLAILQAWLLAAGAAIGGMTLSPRRIATGLAILGLLLAMGASRSREVNPFSLTLSRRLGLPPPLAADTWMTRCDPAWRARVATMIAAGGAARR